MKTYKYKNIWLIFVHIKPTKGFNFKDLIEFNQEDIENYIGAWANVLVKSDTIDKVSKIVHGGLKEKKFDIVFIDKIENVQTLVEYEEIDLNVLDEIEWLLSTRYVFMISDKIFPYTDNE